MRAVLALVLTASIGCSAIVPKANGPSAVSDLMLVATAVAAAKVFPCAEYSDFCPWPEAIVVTLPALVWLGTGFAAIVVSDWDDPPPDPTPDPVATDGSRDPARPPSPP